MQGLEDAAMITAALCVAIPRGVQLGAVDACVEAREEEVVTHQVDHVYVVRLHVAPKGVVGQCSALDVCVCLLACQRRADMLSGVADDLREEVTFIQGRRQGRHGDELSYI